MAHESAGKETPCHNCRPELKSVNIPYFSLFYYCQDQRIMGANGPVGLDMLAIHRGMKDYNVDKDERVEFSLAVRRIANTIFSAQAEEAADRIKRQSKAR